MRCDKELEEQRADVLVREQAARADLERASRLKDEFLAVLSHELRTPLNAVLGYARLLASGVLSSERAVHAVDAIQRNAKAQARLVESLLDLSRIMAGKLQLNLERVDLVAVVEGAIDVVRPDAEARGITLDVERPAEEIVLGADVARLQQVCWNLLANAIKFTPSSGRIGVSIRADRGSAEIRIADNGQGIAPDFLPYVFDRFKQAGQPKGGSTGLGLGLALVREMVHAHGGTVTAESPGEGQGSCFTVRLPLSLSPAEFRPAAATLDGVESLASLDSLDVLVVDDDGDVRDILALLLESHGAKIRTVSSATEALQAISASRPDVMLADLGMPEEDGFSLIRRLRAHEQHVNGARLRAIAVSAHATAADRERASAAGFDGHVAKPVDPELLVQMIVRGAHGSLA